MSTTTTLRLVRSASGADSVIRMFAGELDAAYIGMTPFLLARAHGLRLHLLGIANSLGSSHKVVVRLGTAQPRSVATVATSSAHQLAWTWATSLGLDVSYLDLSPADAVRAFEVGLVDAVSIWEPFAGKVEEAGGETRFDSAAATVPMFNVLAASDASVRAKPSALRQLASAHSAAVATIRQGLSEESTDYLRAVLDLPLGHEEFITLLNYEHEWPDSPALDGDDLPDDLVESAHEALRFLRAARLTPPGGEVEALERSALGRHGRRQETLSLGYSDSLMCAPLHIARHDGHLGENGMDVIQDQEPVVERLARLPEPLRRELRETIEFVGTQPAVATMACGRVLERVLGETYEQALGAKPPRRLSTSIADLEESEVIPPRVSASAHFVRTLRNAAAHALSENISPAEARSCVEQLINVVEWSVRSDLSVVSRCRRCRHVVQPEWTACPHCGQRITDACSSCGASLSPDWKTCPMCGLAASG